MKIACRGADDNVPPWHTREQVGILKTWDSETDVTCVYPPCDLAFAPLRGSSFLICLTLFGLGRYHEDPGKPHWYPDVLSNKRVQDFLNRVYFSSSSPCPAGEEPLTHEPASQERGRTNFTLTVAVPAESGPLNGWQIHALVSPGL